MGELVIDVIKAFKDSEAMSPGDVAQKLGIPKYKALSLVSCLSEMGFLEPLYSRGSYKIYRLSELGEALLQEVEGGRELRDIIEEALGRGATHGTVRPEGVRAESQASP